MSIEVLDMLGTVVERLAPNHTTWDGTHAVSGTYFIRVTGVDGDNMPFVVTRRIVKE